MSINILLNEQGNEPLRFENEYFILKRQDISYLISSESGDKYEGEGYIIITSNRLIIFPKKQNTNFRAIEIPLNQIYSEEFKQPLFGKNYLKGKCRPFFQNQFGNFSFTIWVKGNRAGTLVGVFFTLIDSLRNNQGRNHNLDVIKNLRENNFNAIFAIDTDDESYIYQIQPPSVNIPRQNFQSAIINRPNLNNLNNFNNINGYNIYANNNYNNNNNFSRLNEEEINNEINNKINMSNFYYKRPNDKYIYKDPGFVYKEPANKKPVYDINQIDESYNNHNNINPSNNIRNININNINNINNANYINSNINNQVNNINNINNNFINNNNIKKDDDDDDDDDLVSPYNIQKKNEQNNINKNNINNNININANNNINYNNNANYNIYNNNQSRIQINQNNIQSQYINRNININPNMNNNDMNLESPYQINSQILNRNNNIIINNPQFNKGYSIQNNFINRNNNINNNQMNNPYGQIIGPKINNINNNKVNSNNNKILNFNRNNKYRQLREEILDDNELNSKNQLNNNFSERNIDFDNKQDLSLISHKDDSLPDISNIYPDI